MNKINDDKIMAGLLTCSSQVNAAKAARVSVQTVRRRLADPVFGWEYRRRQMATLDDATAWFSALTPRAVEVFVELLTDDDPNVRLKAANGVMTWALRTREQHATDTRLAELEAKEAYRGAGGRHHGS